MKTVNVLGKEYSIEIHKYDDDKQLSEHSWVGYCCSDVPIIVIADLDDEDHFSFQNDTDMDNYFKSTLRHEIVHAFLNESGLQDNFEHVRRMGHEETMVDWIAIQFPKLLRAFQEVGAM